MSKESDKLLQTRIDELKLVINKLGDPKGDALRCGMEYVNSSEPILNFSLLNTPVEIKYPELVVRNVSDGKIVNTAFQALVCYYLATTAASTTITKEEIKWVSFAELPNGRFYDQAFQGYTGNKLVSHIESDKKKFSDIAEKMNGVKLDFGDLAYKFDFLPKIPVAVVFWIGDEDFSSSCKILFENTVSKFLPTDACAIIGSMLSQTIIKLLEEG